MADRLQTFNAFTFTLYPESKLHKQCITFYAENRLKWQLGYFEWMLPDP